MIEMLSGLPGWAPAALSVLAVSAALLPLVAYVGRRLRTGRWRLTAGTRAWRVAVGLLVVCPTVTGVAAGLGGLVADAQRLDGQDRAWLAELAFPERDAILAALQAEYEVNLDLGIEGLPWSQEPVTPVEVLSPAADIAGQPCELQLDEARAVELTGSGYGSVPDVPGLTTTERASAYRLVCDGQAVGPQDALLGVPVQTELVERSWPAGRVPRGLVGPGLAGAGVGLLVVFLAYALPLIQRRTPGPSDGDALLADLREAVRRDPAERARVVDGVVAVVHEDDAARARLFATMPLDDLLLTSADDTVVTGDGVRLTAAQVDAVNAEIRAQRDAGLAGTFVPTAVDRDAVVLSDDVLREHLVATGRVDAVELAVPGHRTFQRGFLWSFLFAPVIGLGAWVMSSDDGWVQWRYEPVVTDQAAAAFVAHYEAMGVEVQLPPDRDGTDPGVFFFRVEGTRGDDTCVGEVVSGRALLRCGPAVEERVWT